MVKGKTRGDTNVRTSPVIGSNISFTSRGVVEFRGLEITSSLDGKMYIELSELNGTPISGAYLAAWVVDYNKVEPVLFPDTFVMTAPNGEKASYQFVESL